MSNLVPYERADLISFCDKLGTAIAKSGMIQGCGSEEAGQVVALVCYTEGINPVQFSRRYHLIENKPTMRSDAMLAEFRMVRHGDHEIIESTPDAAEIKLTCDGKSHTVRITWEEAKQERWPYKRDGETLKDNWATPRGRANMLWARACSEAVRRMAPEINSGIYTPEEAMDFGTVVPADGVIEGEIVQESVSGEETEILSGGEPERNETTAEELLGEEPKSNGSVRTRRVEKILSLFEEIGISPESTLEKRGIKSFAELSAADADEVIAKLEARAKN